MAKKSKMMLAMKWGDFVLIGIILALCAGLWTSLAMRFSSIAQEAEIVVEGEVVMRVDIVSRQNTYIIPQIKDKLQNYQDDQTIEETRIIHMASRGIHFDLQFKNKMVRFEKSDCPDKICVHTGFISKSGQVAACIPAQVLVKIKGVSSDDGIDVIIK